jgi:trk system potassium uptake protein TrkH
LFGTVFALLLGKELSMRGSSALGEILATDRLGGLRRVVVFVVAITFALEIVGALLFYPMFSAAPDAAGRELSAGGAAWRSVFHSISSFCNAGFSLYTRNMSHGVKGGWERPLRDHWQILGVMAPLIVLGGIGFPVLQDCARYGRDTTKRLLTKLRRAAGQVGKAPRLSLHSKIVLATSVSLVVLGAVILLFVEPAPKPRRVVSGVIGRHSLVERPVVIDKGDWGHMPRSRRAREVVFQSITARTAGFNTIDIAELSDTGKLSLCWLMMIGGSPASTAGGMKTVTFALLLLTAYCVVRRRNELEVFKRSIPFEILRKALTVAVLYLALVSVVTMLLCLTLKLGGRFTFIDMFFEACSACSTVGLSTGVTSSLNVAGKYVIVAGMFIGRLGPLTLLLGLTSGLRHVKYSYPQEAVVIG